MYAKINTLEISLIFMSKIRYVQKDISSNKVLTIIRALKKAFIKNFLGRKVYIRRNFSHVPSD